MKPPIVDALLAAWEKNRQVEMGPVPIVNPAPAPSIVQVPIIPIVQDDRLPDGVFLLYRRDRPITAWTRTATGVTQLPIEGEEP